MGVKIDLEKYYKNTTQSCDTSGQGWLTKCVNKVINDEVFLTCNNILDLGAGTGIWTKKLRKLGFEVTPCDVSNEQFDEIVISDMHNLCFPDKEFDGILCTGTFEHSVAPFIALSEMARVLKAGGILYVDMPADDNTRLINLPQHVNTQCYNNMINMANKLNLELVDHCIIMEKEAREHQYYVFKKQSLISIVMATWNRKEFLPDTIYSVLNQTYPNFEFIIVDDGSEKDTIELLEKFEKEDSRIKLIKTEHSGGTDTTNTGFKNMEGDYVCILGSDDLWTPNKLEVQMEYYKTYKNYILHNNSIGIDENGEIIDHTSFYDCPDELYKEYVLNGTHHSWFVTSSCIIPRNIFDKVGLFEHIYNDYEWFMRAIVMHGAKMKLIPEFLTKHRSNPDGNTFKHIGQKELIEMGKEIQDEMKEYDSK